MNTRKIPKPAIPGTPTPTERLFACSGLLSRAIGEVAAKVGDSSKLARALEDMQHAKDAMEDVALGLVRGRP